ncbi:MAG: hypothetical protein FJ012_11300 [Chloroflexi bacterium]|nr:hypothetical protein [Chloroflexota bacterium]
MSFRAQIILAVVLSVAMVVTGFLPQMAQAHRVGEAVARVEAILASINQPYSGLDIDALIAASPECAKEGLLLVTRKNTWTTHPASHDELVKCLEESYREDGWSGASVVSQVYQNGNIHGSDDNYISYYEAFFYAGTAGTWQFATDSNAASEIEIDGHIVASWYGEHTVSGDWSHNGSIALAVGWHHLIYRHEKLSGSEGARAAFKKPGDTNWRPLSTSQITLKPVNLDEGLLLVTRKNTWSTHPQNHDEMVKCVERDSTQESGWYGGSIVIVLNQDENMHGNDDHYTSYYEAFFYAETAGTWRFATDSDGASEIEIDGHIVASWYGGHTASGGWSHNGSINLTVGWHRLIYRHEESTGAQMARAAFNSVLHSR